MSWPGWDLLLAGPQKYHTISTGPVNRAMWPAQTDMGLGVKWTTYFTEGAPKIRMKKCLINCFIDCVMVTLD